MLVLARKVGEDIYLDDDIRITIVSIHGSICKVGIEAPKEVRVLRAEVRKRIRKESGGDGVLEVRVEGPRD